MADPAPGTAPVTDQRVAPRGVLPRHTQTWLMVVVALGILGIILFTGHPEPAPRTTAASNASALNPNPDRLRDYQDRLRVMDERARQQAVTEPRAATPAGPAFNAPPAATASPDAIQAERKRREYDSLFSSNVVMSRRPEGQRLPVPREQPARGLANGVPAEGASRTPPSLDDVADAVVRATTRYAPSGASVGVAATPAVSAPANPPATTTAKPRAAATGPISDADPLHRLVEGTVIDTVLTNRLDGGASAPVNCLVTNAVYSHEGQHVLIPAGSRVLGDTKPVQAFGESRLAVAFNRLVLPDGRTYPLDQFLGLNDIGDAGLKDQVDQHYRSTFGASAAVGLISGFAQYLGAAGFGGASGGGTVIIAGGAGESTAQATSQTLNRFLNRMPTITIREGHRIKVYLTSDLELPAYQAPATREGGLLAQSSRRLP